jgi:hypothetical protein
MLAFLVLFTASTMVGAAFYYIFTMNDDPPYESEPIPARRRLCISLETIDEELDLEETKLIFF